MGFRGFGFGDLCFRALGQRAWTKDLGSKHSA